MPNSGEKAAHSGHPGHHGHHDMHVPHDERTEDDRDLLKGKPFPLTSKPTHVNEEKPPIRTERRNG